MVQEDHTDQGISYPVSLINETRYREAIDILLPDQSSPYDSRREYYLALAYNQIGKTDSAQFWLTRAKLLKPLSTLNVES